MGLLDELNIDKVEFEKIEAESVPEGVTIPTGVYSAAVDQAYIRKTPAGAKMLEIDFLLTVGEDTKKYHWATAIQSGDEKGNKTTWTVTANHSEMMRKRYGVGTEVQLPGVGEMKHFLQAIKEADPATTMGVAKHKDENIEALCLTTVQGKRVTLGIHQEEGLYNGSVTVRNTVKYWMDDEGKNGDGKDIQDTATKWLERNPIKRLKGAKVAPTNTGADATAIAATDW